MSSKFPTLSKCSTCRKYYYLHPFLVHKRRLHLLSPISIRLALCDHIKTPWPRASQNSTFPSKTEVLICPQYNTKVSAFANRYVVANKRCSSYSSDQKSPPPPLIFLHPISIVPSVGEAQDYGVTLSAS